MVSANVVDTLQRILPVEQNLIPVSLKRRMQYSGHYMQEYVDRYKIKQYFLWFQRHNHIFHNMELNETLIDKFEEESRKITEREDIAKVVIITDHDEIKKKVINDGGSDSEEEVEEETIKLEKENVLSDHSSFITDKYLEDINAPTVANKFSDMILSLEENTEADEIFNPDPEQAFYVEDEIYVSDDELDDDDDVPEGSDVSLEELDSWNQMKNMKIETRQSVHLLKTNTANLCKCEVERKISFILNQKFQLEKMSVVHNKLTTLKDFLMNEFSSCIESSRYVFKSISRNCHHEYNTMQQTWIKLLIS